MKNSKFLALFFILLIMILLQNVYFNRKFDQIDLSLNKVLVDINNQKQQFIEDYYFNRKMFINVLNYNNDEDYKVNLFGRNVYVRLNGRLPRDMYLVENSLNNSVGIYYIDDNSSISLRSYTLEMKSNKLTFIKSKDFVISTEFTSKDIINIRDIKRIELEKRRIEFSLSLEPYNTIE